LHFLEHLLLFLLKVYLLEGQIKIILIFPGLQPLLYETIHFLVNGLAALDESLDVGLVEESRGGGLESEAVVEDLDRV
jgi:hypothetical protein